MISQTSAQIALVNSVLESGARGSEIDCTSPSTAIGATIPEENRRHGSLLGIADYR